VGRPSTATEETKPDITVILEMIRGAQSYIYASYFLLTSEEVARALIALARMGRQVLLYLDANQASKGGNTNAAIVAMCLVADIKVKVRPSTSMMHEKFMYVPLIDIFRNCTNLLTNYTDFTYCSLVDGTMLFVGSSIATVNGVGTTGHPVARNQEANVYLERSTISKCVGLECNTD
jgi:hypothetical protein